MRRINKMRDGTPLFSSSNPQTRSHGLWECWSSELTNGRAGTRPYQVFCGLSLELFARPVITNETVLPKAAVTAGKMLLRLNLSVASAALRDARQRYLWKGEW